MSGIDFEGHSDRECSEHRTTGNRAWCFDCNEWCYPDGPCRGCELPKLRARVEKAEAELAVSLGEDEARELTADRDNWKSVARNTESVLGNYRRRAEKAEATLAEAQRSGSGWGRRAIDAEAKLAKISELFERYTDENGDIASEDGWRLARDVRAVLQEEAKL